MYLYKKLYVILSSIHKENKNIKVKTPKQSCSAPYPYKILGMSAEFSCFQARIFPLRMTQIKPTQVSGPVALKSRMVGKFSWK